MKRAITFLLLAFCLFHFSAATTFTVTTVSDAGAGSLREAMTFCNLTPGADNVVFNIPGQAPHTIYCFSSLPVLNDAGTTIDGTTQPANGYTGNGRKIIIDGSQFQNGDGIEVNGANFTLKGVRIQKFPYNGLVINAGATGYVLGGVGAGNTISENYYRGIEVNGAANGTLKGNFIGTDDAGLVAKANEYEGLVLNAGCNGTVIGGVLAGEGNVISGNRYQGIQIEASTNCSILGNMIGVNATGTAAIPNEYEGIFLTNGANGNTIGSATAGGSNVISANLYSGILIECSNNNVVKGNKIGTDMSGGTALGNQYSGVQVGVHYSNYGCPSSGNTIGGLNAGEGNVIANSGYYGVNVWGTNANQNPIRGNVIYCNGYDGISLEDGNYMQPDGNNGYASPVILAANAAGANGTAAANDWVDLYIDDQCQNCEPRSFVATVQANGTGNWSYGGALSGSLTAIATNNINNNSSANSPCFFITNSTVPLANFMAITTDFCGSGCTSFLDFSTGQPTSWSWTFPGGTPSTSNLQNPQNICYSAPGTYDVTLVATNGSGSDTRTLTGYITVTTAPVVSAGPDVSICEGDTTQLQGQSNGGYVWSIAAGLSDTTIASPLAFPTSTTSYVLTGQNANCSVADTVLVTVFPAPTVSINAIGPLLTATNGVTFQWLLNGSPISGATSQSFTALTSGNYAVSITDANGCSAVSASIFIDVASAIGETLHLHFEVGPNPASEMIHLSASGLLDDRGEIQIVDLLGRILQQESVDVEGGRLGIQLNVSQLATGMYRIVLRTESGIGSVNFAVER